MKRRSTVETIDEKINAIRRAAGNPGLRCPTCGRSEHDPYRRVVGGKFVEGCVDSFTVQASRAGASLHRVTGTCGRRLSFFERRNSST